MIAVGTTSMRALEWPGRPRRHRSGPGQGWCDLLIAPGHSFRVAQGLLTNFHLPRTSLLMLAAALVGRERLLAAYDQAVEAGYRFYSYGDAMLVDVGHGARLSFHPNGSASGRARTGEPDHPAGDCSNTPLFMPVGTLGTVKSLLPEEVAQLGGPGDFGQHLSPACCGPGWRWCAPWEACMQIHGLARPHPDR